MDETLWEERVFLHQMEYPVTCPVSGERVSEGDYAVVLKVDGGDLTGTAAAALSLGAVDQLSRAARSAIGGDSGFTHDTINTTGDANTSFRNECSFCEYENEHGGPWISFEAVTDGFFVNICGRCLDNFVDSIEGVWEYGDTVAPEQL